MDSPRQARWVMHIDMDAFYASVEQLTRPTLRGRPVIVGGLSGRGVVAGCSYEARASGVHSAMPIFQAEKLVGPRAVFVRPRRAVYEVVSRRVFEVIARHSEVIEQLSIDEAFIEPAELAGASVAEAEAFAHRLRADIATEVGLAASIGAGSGKQFAKIGSGRAKPDGALVIAQAEELDFLHPLPVQSLWGIGPVSTGKLRAIGVSTIGEFAALSLPEVQAVLGHTVGPQLWRLARGVDDRPVQARAEAKSVSAEYTYPADLTTVELVDAAIVRAAAQAFRRLQRDGRAPRTVTVKIKRADFQTETRSLTLPYPTLDEQVLRDTALSLARYPHQVGPIRLVGVGYSGLSAQQDNMLFPELDRVAIDLARRPISTEISDEALAQLSPQRTTWFATQDIRHRDYGHGWIQGLGHGVMSVRFETRTSGPGRTRTFSLEQADAELEPADPLACLDWPELNSAETAPEDPSR